MPVLDASSFAIGFDPRDREALHRLWDEVIASQRWTEGRLTERFEEAWERWNGIGAVATAGWEPEGGRSPGEKAPGTSAREMATTAASTVAAPVTWASARRMAAKHAASAQAASM